MITVFDLFIYCLFVLGEMVAVQQLHMLSVGGRNGPPERKHSRSASDLSDSSSTTSRMGILEDSRKNAVLYTHVIAFTLFELETITKSFRSDYILGEGGFGTVYKGYIDENVRVGLKSLPVAVKVLNKEGLQGHREWLVSYFHSFLVLIYIPSPYSDIGLESVYSVLFSGPSPALYYKNRKFLEQPPLDMDRCNGQARICIYHTKS